jgi:hypothetical protein
MVAYMRSSHHPFHRDGRFDGTQQGGREGWGFHGRNAVGADIDALAGMLTAATATLLHKVSPIVGAHVQILPDSCLMHGDRVLPRRVFLEFFRVEIQLNRRETEQLVVNLQRLLRGETVEQVVSK